MYEIIPAILPKNENELREGINRLPQDITFFHMDVLEDDIWVLNDRDFEVHLMVDKPEEIMGRWIERGAKRISVHTAGNSLAKYREKAEIGLAVELDKNLDEVMPFLDFVDFIHLMSIDEIGQQGHALDENIFNRIKLVQKNFPNLPIAVDGGININNYQKLIDLGADRLVIGSHFTEVWSKIS